MIDASMIPDFIVEAREHLDDVESSLLKLESDGESLETLNEIFRAMHTIKGAAQFVGIERVGELSHKLENLLDLIRQGERDIDYHIINTLIEGKDRISLLVEEVEKHQEEKSDISDLLTRIQDHEKTPEDSGRLPDKKSILKESAPAEMPIAGVAAVEEIELTEDFKELFSDVDEFSEDDFAEDTTVLAALSDDRPNIAQPQEKDKKELSPDAEDDAAALTEQEPLKPDSTEVDIDWLDGKLESLFAEEEAPPAPQKTEIDTAALKKEIESEEFDEELFQIFIQQLQENISLLRALTNGFIGAPSKTSVVGQCSDLVSKLHSSANYMGYDRLSGFYGQWIAELEMVDLELSLGSQISFDFMNANIAKIAEIFPQIADSSTEKTLPHEAHDEITHPPYIPPPTEEKIPVETNVEEEEKPEDFKELLSDVDEISEDDFAEDTTVLAALSGERPDSSEEPFTGRDDELESLFGDEEEPSPAPKQKDVARKTVRKPPQAEIDIAALKDKIESEEFDDELFQIFIQQLQENISLLRAFTNEFAGAPSKTSVVGQCSDLVSKLHSSANYMGYDRLSGFYGQWIAELEMVDLELSLGSQISFDFMNSNIAKIAEIFPQITDSSIEKTLPHETHDDITPPPLITPPAEPIVETEEKPEDKVADQEVTPSEKTGEKPAPEPEASDVEDEFEHIEAAFTDDGAETDGKKITAPDIYIKQAVSTLPDEKEEKTIEDNADDTLSAAIEHFTEDITVEEPAVPDKISPDEVDEVDIEVNAFEQAIDSFQETDPRRTKLLVKLSGELESLSGELDGPLPDEDEETLLALLQDEIKHEDYDRDLFEIYVKQVHEGIMSLCSLIDGFAENDNKLHVLNQCAEIIENLRSSSNYMDYEHFTQFYRLWVNEIKDSGEKLPQGQTVILEFMAGNIDLVTRVFPKIPRMEFALPVKKDVMATPDDVEDALQTGEQETPAAELELFDRLSDALDKEDEKHLHDRLSDALESDEDQQLFDKLSSALESSTIKLKPTALKPIDDVINEILSGEGLAQPPSPAAPASSLLKRISPQVTSTVSPTYKNGFAKDTALKTDLRQEDADRRIRITDRRRGLEDRRLGDSAETPAVKQSIRVDADKIDFLMNQVGELVVNKSYISQLSNEMIEMEQYFKDIGHLDNEKLKPFKEYIFKLNQANVALGRVSSEIQDGVMNVRMLPVGQLFKRYPRLIRDLVYQSGKKVDLVIMGEDTELDKMVIEEISAPLIHIIRNAVDHGIETVEERREAGKEETAVLRLEAYPDSSNIVIEITDDGRGIDPQIIKAKALEKNLYPADKVDLMSDQELIRLIMIPGFSTVEQATSTSGRGVGMDVVKTNIEKLNGSIDIESVVGHETLIRVRIPLTLAIIQALSVKVGSKTLTIPLTSVVETARIRRSDISTVEGVELVDHRNVPLPVLRLAEILNIDTEETAGDHLYIVIVSAEGQRAGLVVDKFVGKDEAVIKPLADYLRRESGFSGATIKGDGTISLIIDIPTLLDIVKERQVTQHKKQVLNRSLKGLAIA